MRYSTKVLKHKLTGIFSQLPCKNNKFIFARGTVGRPEHVLESCGSSPGSFFRFNPPGGSSSSLSFSSTAFGRKNELRKARKMCVSSREPLCEYLRPLLKGKTHDILRWAIFATALYVSQMQQSVSVPLFIGSQLLVLKTAP
jgi:hypothetical protein